MTSTEMHTSFKNLLDKTDALNYPNFLAAEIDFWLNYAQERFVKQRYTGFSAKKLSFEEVQKRSDDLRLVVLNVVITPDAADPANKTDGRFFDLPADYVFAVDEQVTMDVTDCNGDTETLKPYVKPIKHDSYTKLARDPFNKPNNKRVLRLSYRDKSEILFPAGATPTNYILRYIQTPADIELGVTDSQLADHTHQEIVDIAVITVLENIESPRYGTNLQELSKQE